MEYFDSHSHYDDERFNEDRKEIIQEVYSNGITKILSAGYSLQGSISGIELAKEYSFIYTTLGISPNDLTENWEQDVAKIEKLLKTTKIKDEKGNNKVVAVGEIGLDYYYDTNKEWQKSAFIRQIELANKYDLPIVIHTREAVMDTIEILKANVVNKKGIFHCCPFNKELVKEALKLGFYISIAGPVTFKNAKNAPDVIQMIPMDRILIETDSPYLAPEPVRGTRNNSKNLKYIAQKIADIKGISAEEIAMQTYKNAERIYEIKN